GPKSGTYLTAPLLTAEHSGVIRQVWAWILTDPATRAWLGGAPDENGMLINPAYKDLNLGGSPVDSFPRGNACISIDSHNRCTLDVLPYTENFDDAASRVRVANNPEGPDWDPLATAPDGSPGWWKVTQPIEFPGQTFMWGVMDTASLANYGV